MTNIINTSQNPVNESGDAGKPARTVRKLTIEIIDEEKVLAAYPGVKLVVVKDTIDRQKLRPIVNALHAIGLEVPGVRAYYAKDEAEKADSEVPPALRNM